MPDSYLARQKTGASPAGELKRLRDHPGKEEQESLTLRRRRHQFGGRAREKRLKGGRLDSRKKRVRLHPQPTGIKKKGENAGVFFGSAISWTTVYTERKAFQKKR